MKTNTQAFNEGVQLGHVYRAEKDGVAVAGYKKFRSLDFNSKEERTKGIGTSSSTDPNVYKEFSDNLDSLNFELDLDKLSHATIVYCQKTNEASLSEEWKGTFADAVKEAAQCQTTGIRFLNKIKGVHKEQHDKLKSALAEMTTCKNKVQHLLDFGELCDNQAFTTDNIDKLMVDIGTSMSEVSDEVDHVKITLKSKGIEF